MPFAAIGEDVNNGMAAQHTLSSVLGTTETCPDPHRAGSEVAHARATQLIPAGWDTSRPVYYLLPRKLNNILEQLARPMSHTRRHTHAPLGSLLPVLGLGHMFFGRNGCSALGSSQP